MSSPTSSASGSGAGSLPRNLEAGGVRAPGGFTNALALSGLLKVQRRWTLSSSARGDSEVAEASYLEPQSPEFVGHPPALLPVHLEDPEWSRLALGVTAECLAKLDWRDEVQLLQLGPDSITVHLSMEGPAPAPFRPGRVPLSWSLPRDPRLIAGIPVTAAIANAAGRSALATLSSLHGRRVLVDLIALGATVMSGAPTELGTKLAEVAVELGSRRWSDLGLLVLVAFDSPTPGLGVTRHVPDVASALEEATIGYLNGGASSLCVIVPPWALDPADPCLGELARFCAETPGAGLLCGGSFADARCSWQLDGEPGGAPSLELADGRRFEGVDLSELGEAPAHRFTRGAAEAKLTAPAPPVEIAILGNVQVNGAPESFRYRRRLTELVAFLAMHPEGATTDSFATALWPERRVPVQTLANRLSETRKALGIAADGRPRLRKAGRRHLIVDAETDWERFKVLGDKRAGWDSWRKALALVRGRPFEGLERGEWAQLEGFAAAIEAEIVGLACRLGEHALDERDAGLAHWAALQGLLVSPWDERLYRLLMRAADAMGNRGGIEAALRSLAAALELEGDPLLGIHPETSALYRRLTSRAGT
jgi:DNA-binding SARP family transcriptional activator